MRVKSLRSYAVMTTAIFFVVLVGCYVAAYVQTGIGPRQATGVIVCVARKGLGVPCSIIDELDHMCSVVKAATKQEFATPAEKSKWITDRISEGLRTREAVDALKAIGFARPEDKPRLIRSIAAENGAPNWSCPELETLVQAPNSP